MRSSGPIQETDSKLFLCDPETGREGLISWGNHEDAITKMERMARSGGDVWVVSPAGVKTVPSSQIDGNTAERICSLSIEKAVQELNDLGAIKTHKDGTDMYSLGDFVFFRAFDDSKTLYYEG